MSPEINTEDRLTQLLLLFTDDDYDYNVSIFNQIESNHIPIL